MNVYASTFITGFSEPVEKILKEKLEDVEIVKLLDGLVLYRTEADIETIKNFKFINNSFFVIQLFLHLPPEKGLPEMIDWFKRENRLFQYLKPFATTKTSFKFTFSKENQFIGINKEQLGKLENKLMANANLAANRVNADLDLWFFERLEGVGFFGVRITRHGDYQKILQKGELRPELAFLLNYLSNPSQDDVFLDPFSGFGAIPKSRALHFPFKSIIASDKIADLVERMKAIFKQEKLKIEARILDAESLEGLEDNSIDKIVTDSPWGLYQEENINNLYSLMMKSFLRVLKKNSLMVLLTASDQTFMSALKPFKTKVKIIKEFRTLVSGKKAKVFVLQIL